MGLIRRQSITPYRSLSMFHLFEYLLLFDAGIVSHLPYGLVFAKFPLYYNCYSGDVTFLLHILWIVA